MRNHFLTSLSILSILFLTSKSVAGDLSIIFEGINSAQAGLLLQRKSFMSKVVFGASYRDIKQDDNTSIQYYGSFSINANAGYQKYMINDLCISFMPGVIFEFNHNKEITSETSDSYLWGPIFNIGVNKKCSNWTIGINNDMIIYFLGLNKRSDGSSVIKTRYKEISLNFLPKILIGFGF